MNVRYALCVSVIAFAAASSEPVLACPLTPPCCPIPCPVSEWTIQSSLRDLNREADQVTGYSRKLETSAGQLADSFGARGSLMTHIGTDRTGPRVWNVSHLDQMIAGSQEGNLGAREGLRRGVGVAADGAAGMATQEPRLAAPRLGNLRGKYAAEHGIGLARNDIAAWTGYLETLASYGAATNVRPGRSRPPVEWTRVVTIPNPSPGQPRATDCAEEISAVIDGVNIALIARDIVDAGTRYRTDTRASARLAIDSLNASSRQLRAATGRPGTAEVLMQAANRVAFRADWTDPDARDREIASVASQLLDGKGTPQTEAALRGYLQSLAFVQWEAEVGQHEERGAQADRDFLREIGSRVGAEAAQGDVAGFLRSISSSSCLIPPPIAELLRGAMSGATTYVPRSLLSVLQ